MEPASVIVGVPPSPGQPDLNGVLSALLTNHNHYSMVMMTLVAQGFVLEEAHRQAMQLLNGPPTHGAPLPIQTHGPAVSYTPGTDAEGKDTEGKLLSVIADAVWSIARSLPVDTQEQRRIGALWERRAKLGMEQWATTAGGFSISHVPVAVRLIVCTPHAHIPGHQVEQAWCRHAFAHEKHHQPNAVQLQIPTAWQGEAAPREGDHINQASRAPGQFKVYG